MTARVSLVVRHKWVRTPDGPGTHRCSVCYSWTANLPLCYQFDVCPKLDRRSGKDRRKA